MDLLWSLKAADCAQVLGATLVVAWWDRDKQPTPRLCMFLKACLPNVHYGLTNMPT
jgi:hypothetical protein